ncbi:MAG: response regulator transcription factor [Cyanobacteriota bacterium]
MRILLAEDDARLAEPLRDFLTLHHHTVDWFDDGQKAWQALESGAYALALLDWMLPGRDGLSILRDLRRQQRPILVLMLTARDALPDRLVGFEEGADDYLVKPFQVELAARIRALERRSERPYQSSRLRWGPLELDAMAAQVWCHGQALSLTTRELQLLEWFLRHPGQLFSRMRLLEALWSLEADVGEETVKTHLNNLRRKLRQVAGVDPIDTVHGQGYRLAGPL